MERLGELQDRVLDAVLGLGREGAAGRLLKTVNVDADPEPGT